METCKENFYKVLLKLTKTNKIEWKYEDFDEKRTTVYLQNLPMEADNVTDLASEKYKEVLTSISIDEQEVSLGYIYETKICAKTISQRKEEDSPSETSKDCLIRDYIKYVDSRSSIIHILYRTILDYIKRKEDEDYTNMIDTLTIVEDAFIDNKLIPSDIGAADSDYLEDINQELEGK